MATPAELLAEATNSLFGGNAAKFNVASDPAIWTIQNGVVSLIANDGRSLTLLRQKSSAALGASKEPIYASIIQSPVVYAGRNDMADESLNPPFYSEEFRSKYVGMYWEARYGLDKEMKVATPFLNNGDNNVPSPYIVDLFPITGSLKNWNSSQPQSLLVNTSVEDENKRLLPFSGNKTPLQNQATGIVEIIDVNTHPTDPQLRQIRHISSVNMNTKQLLAVSITTEQRRRQTLPTRKGSNPSPKKVTEDFGLYRFNDSLTPEYIGQFNGSNWTSADLREAHLVVGRNDLSTILFFVPNSHPQFTQHAAQVGSLHVGTISFLTNSDANLFGGLLPIYFVPGTDGYDSIEIISACFERESVTNYLLTRYKLFDGTNNVTGFAIYSFNVSDPVILTFVCELNRVGYSNNQQRLTSFNLRGICNKPHSSTQLYAVGNYSIGDIYKPESYLFEITLATGDVDQIRYIDNRSITSIAIGDYTPSDLEDMGTMYGIDGESMQLVQIAHHDNYTVITKEKGVLTIDVLDQAAQNQSVWTTLNNSNERAAQTYDLMVLTLESTKSGELIEIEFGATVSVNDQRTPVPAFIRRYADNQRYRIQLKANEPVDVFINISNTEFGNGAFRRFRHLGFRIVDASEPFSVKVLRAQMCKVQQTQNRLLIPSPETMQKYGVFAPFSSTDRRILSWFVQFRAVIISQIPPSTPKQTGWTIQRILAATVINNPYGRLRGGRTRTPYVLDPALTGNVGFSQTPVKIPGAYLSDGFVVGQIDDEFGNFNLSSTGSIANGGIQTLPSGFQAGIQSVVSYEIVNNGNSAFTIVGVQISNIVNAIVTIRQLTSPDVVAGGSVTLQIDITPIADGDFSYRVDFGLQGTSNQFTFTAEGTTQLTPPGTPTLIYDRDHVTLGSGTDINEVDDQSGQGLDAIYVAGGVGKAQLSSAVMLDGDSTIHPQNNAFNEASQYRSSAGNTWADVMPSNRLSLVGVVYVNSILAFFGAPDHIIFASDAGTGFYPKIEAVSGPNLRFGWFSSLGTVVITRPIALGTWYVFTARADGSNIKLQVDNNTEISAAAMDNTAPDERIQLFNDGGDAGSFDGYMAYTAGWDGAISDTEVADMKAYLKQRWPSLNV